MACIGFVCFRGPRPRGPICSVKGCDKPAPYLCDAPIKPRQRGRKLQTTCGRKLCEEHRTAVGDVDHCPFHVAKWQT
jgi:hypothetical protein